MLLRGLVLLVLLVLFVATAFYLRSEIYSFPPSKAFEGKAVYNPYRIQPALRFKANFHAHSRSWWGWTNGHQSDSEMVTAYLGAGYQLPGLSNYHRVSSWAQKHAPLYLPVYESGYNPLKAHWLVMGLNQPSFFDFPLYQGRFQQQYVIHHLRNKGAVLSMAHPDFGGGRRLDHMESLVGYHFMEVFNHYRHSEKYYDRALSSGRLSWLMANDDTHDLHREATFKRWNVWFGDSLSIQNVLEHALLGRHYVVYAEDSSFPKSLVGTEDFHGPADSVNPSDSGAYRAVFRFSHPFAKILAVGQGGKVLDSVLNSDSMVVSLPAHEPYLRVEARDADAAILLNPLVRYDGVRLPLTANQKAEIRTWATWFFRLGVVVILILVLKAGIWVARWGN